MPSTHSLNFSSGLHLTILNLALKNYCIPTKVPYCPAFLYFLFLCWHFHFWFGFGGGWRKVFFWRCVLWCCFVQLLCLSRTSTESMATQDNVLPPVPTVMGRSSWEWPRSWQCPAYVENRHVLGMTQSLQAPPLRKFQQQDLLCCPKHVFCIG